MSLTIKAQIPADNGKTMTFSAGGGTLTVGPATCEGYNCECEAEATVLTKGESDSYGWEPVYYCASCLAKANGESDSYGAALGVEDRAGFFYISECTNYDGHGEWAETFTSYRDAVAYLRDIEERAAQWSGLYPNKGVRECQTAEAFAGVKARFARARRELEEELYRELEEELYGPDVDE